MPYAFAHPAAVIPLYRLLGKFAVPSALVIGSVIPDAWYFVPVLTRSDSHSAAGLFLFCLPAGLFVYAAFHLIFKQPLLALLPRALASRLGAWTCPSLPSAPWRSVLVSLLVGVLTHFAWDAVTHGGIPALEIQILTLGNYELRAYQVLQHASTLLGTAFVIWWLARKLRAGPDLSLQTREVSAPARVAIVAMLALLPAASFTVVVLAVSPFSLTVEGLRSALRPAGVTALSTLGFGMLAYCVLWRRRYQLNASSAARSHR
jgi:hypothetical protein